MLAVNDDINLSLRHGTDDKSGLHMDGMNSNLHPAFQCTFSSSVSQDNAISLTPIQFPSDLYILHSLHFFGSNYADFAVSRFPFMLPERRYEKLPDSQIKRWLFPVQNTLERKRDMVPL